MLCSIGHEIIIHLPGKVYTKGSIGIACGTWSNGRLWPLDLVCFFFIMADSHNYIYVLQRLPVFVRPIEGHVPPCNYKINSHHTTKATFSPWDLSKMTEICEPNQAACWLLEVSLFFEERELHKGCRAGLWCAPNSICDC
jgi:hypothetical protein